MPAVDFPASCIESQRRVVVRPVPPRVRRLRVVPPVEPLPSLGVGARRITAAPGRPESEEIPESGALLEQPAKDDHKEKTGVFCMMRKTTRQGWAAVQG